MNDVRAKYLPNLIHLRRLRRPRPKTLLPDPHPSSSKKRQKVSVQFFKKCILNPLTPFLKFETRIYLLIMLSACVPVCSDSFINDF